MIERAENNQRIEDYYKVTQPFYKWMWHKNALGLHYGIWDDGIRNRQEAILYENEYLADLAGIGEGALILDAGCGIGGSSFWLAKRGAEVVGINLSDAQLKEADKIVKCIGNVSEDTEFVKGDYHFLPFQDSTFDFVWSLESIEHAFTVGEFVQESARVLKPGGRLVIAGTLKGQKAPTEEEKRQLDVATMANRTFRDFKNAPEIEQIMTKTGFEDIFSQNLTPEVMPSASQIKNMCLWGYPTAKVLAATKLVSPIMVLNNEWGLYQKNLFSSGVTEYDVIVGTKGE